jgi:hypothetical protein
VEEALYDFIQTHAPLKEKRGRDPGRTAGFVMLCILRELLLQSGSRATATGPLKVFWYGGVGTPGRGTITLSPDDYGLHSLGRSTLITSMSPVTTMSTLFMPTQSRPSQQVMAMLCARLARTVPAHSVRGSHGRRSTSYNIGRALPTEWASSVFGKALVTSAEDASPLNGLRYSRVPSRWRVIAPFSPIPVFTLTCIGNTILARESTRRTKSVAFNVSAHLHGHGGGIPSELC